jgi:putative ABC transport system permease protein
MIWTNVSLALGSIRGSKVRSLLTMFAVIIGVMAFTLVTTTVEGLKASVSDQIEDFGGNLMQITPGQSVVRDEEGNVESFNFAAAFGTSTLTERDLQTAKETEGVIAAAPQMLVSGLVTRGDQELPEALIIATNEDYPAALNQTVESGSFFEDDAEGSRNVTVVGKTVVEKLFAGTVSLGSTISIRGEAFAIIGVMEEVESSGFSLGPSLNDAILIPFESGKKFNDGNAQIQEIDLQLGEGVDQTETAAVLTEKILENHGGEEDFSVIKQDEILGLTDSIFDIIKTASQVISYIMLFVGGVVIMLIMLITVTERTREIGIRKSIGATNSNILIQFMTEAVVLTWVGSIIGIIIAFLLGIVIQMTADITPRYSVNTLAVIVILSTVVGVIAGIWPASRAARKDPVEALRHE